MRLTTFLTLAVTLALAEPSIAEPVASGVAGMAFDHDVPVIMTDGLQLRVNIYRPEKSGRYPVLMLMGPYGKDTSMADAPAYKTSWAKLIAKYPDLCKKSSCRYIRFEAPDPERWVANGYIVVHADVRGAGASPGVLDPFSPRETEDYATLIAWAAHQPWSSGKVGLLGTSFQAINQYQVAALHPQGLAAILPWEGAFDQYREIGYYGGLINVAWEYWWTHQVVPNQNGNAGTPLVDSISGGKDTGAPLPPDALKQNRIDPVASFAKHPFDDAYYQQRTPNGTQIVTPMLAIANWTDWSTEGYRAAASKQKWLRIQTGDHLTPFYSEEAFALQKRFFDHFLKGAPNGWEEEPRVAVQVRRPDGTAWRPASAWPLPGTHPQRWYLNAETGSMSTAPVSVVAKRSYPGSGEGLTFTSAPFEQETEFTGPIGARLWVSSSTKDMDIFAAVRLIDPQGRDVTFMGNSDPNVPLGLGYLRVSQRAEDPAKSTEYVPFHPHLGSEPMTPGEFYPTDVEFSEPTSIVIPKGYRLALTIQGKDFGYGPHANIAHARDYDLPNSDNSGLFFAAHPNRDPAIYGGTDTLATGGAQASYLLLPHVTAR
ncbi:putative acyl esterase [Acetobacter nitrogenifigens DSM 23921 = NBRC 105050]|uniref:Peptidase S15 n=1 Tax=Acetobacter nitrogenifigens DSM 23921 = NBRC 105050 TaxID=1120919 RepID=A0A511XEY1_9PROT|nr:CocE/NonD family hydrolase [Acetobacter nitrogenifigens]GBQ99713.1 putative acyl esterase [Acetobacter nitrogenifigens DSM 23921 = NBRC 105050]GEN61455.1 peptidase S15 [Acetobacter nitrogenifigens DSM 23921 = NBRC 105050]